jgi:low molecular weight protein-tyrosine phosphatase
VALILAVCTGNICRSPMAEGFLRKLLAERGIGGIDVASCGVNGLEDSPAMPEGVQAMIENGVDISAHRARRMTARMIREADLVLTMATEHRDTIVDQVVGAAEKTFTLKEFARLLDRVPHRPSVAGDGDDRMLAEAVAAAATLRAGGTVPPSRDEDVADPLGLGVEAYRATAWEIGQLCERVVIGVFGAGLAKSGGGARREGGV